MFKIGDYVVNANNGICEITDIVLMNISGDDKDKKYYLLVPLGEKTAKVYVPMEKAEERFRKIIEASKAWQIIDRIPEIEEIHIKNDKEREQKYKEILRSGDLEKTIGIIKNIYQRKQVRTAQGKKNTVVDERYFKLAEDNLYAELAFALGKEKEEMVQIIKERIGKRTETLERVH